MFVQLLWATVVILAIVTTQVSGYLRVCYYTNWSQYRPGNGKYTPDKIDPNLCTHIIFAFGKLEENRLVPFEWNDDNTDWRNGMYAKVNSLKKKNPQLKTLLATGGWNAGSKPFSDMVASRSNRSEFVSSTIEFLRKRDFDGLDLDWEYPAKRGGRPQDKARLVLLLQELRSAFDKDAYVTGKDRLLLTAAVPAGKSNIDAGYDVRSVAQLLDFISLMSYDFHGSWESTTGHNSPLYARQSDAGEAATLNMAWAANYWVQNGAPREKLIIGIGLYGRSFQLTSAADSDMGALAKGAGPAGKFTKEAGFMSYYEVCKELKKGAKRIWDPEQRVPYAVKGDLWVGYDDSESIKEKVTWLKQGGYGGVMVWSLALDDFSGKFCNNGPYPLLRLINRELDNSVGDFNRMSGMSSLEPVAPAPAPPTEPRAPIASNAGSSINRVHKNPPRRVDRNLAAKIIKRVKTPPKRFAPLDVAPMEAVVDTGPIRSPSPHIAKLKDNVQAATGTEKALTEIKDPGIRKTMRTIGSQKDIPNNSFTSNANVSPEVMPVIPMEITNALLSSSGNSGSDMFPLNIGSDTAPATFTNVFSSLDNSGTTNDVNDNMLLPPPVIVPLDNPFISVNSVSGTEQNLLASELSQNANTFSSAIKTDGMAINPAANSVGISSNEQKPVGILKLKSTKSVGFGLPELKRGPNGSFIIPTATSQEVKNFKSGSPARSGPNRPRFISLFDRNLPTVTVKPSSMTVREEPGLAAISLIDSSQPEAVPIVGNVLETPTKPTPTPRFFSAGELLSALDQRNTAILRNSIRASSADLSSQNRPRLMNNSSVPNRASLIRSVFPASLRRAVVTIPQERGIVRSRNAIVINPRPDRLFTSSSASSSVNQNNRRLVGSSKNTKELDTRTASTDIPSRTASRIRVPSGPRTSEVVASIIGSQSLTPSQAIALRFRLNRDIKIVPLIGSGS